MNCIRYAVNHGARVINNAWGPGRSGALAETINYAYRQGCILTFSAGNANSAVHPDAAAANDKVITVAATDKTDARLSSSNYGSQVDVSAPGYLILSTSLNGTYSERSGTSSACAHVSGLVALLLKQAPHSVFTDVKNALKSNCDKNFHEAEKPIGAGRINALKAIKFICANEKKYTQLESETSHCESHL
jgi:subtilisin family serine protease